MLCDIECKACFAHTRPAGYDYKLAFLKPAKQTVKLIISGRKAGYTNALSSLDICERIGKQTVQGNRRTGNFFFGNGEYTPLGLIEFLANLTAFTVGTFENSRTCRYKLTKNRFVLYDLGVILDVSGSGNGLRYLNQVINPSDRLEFVKFLEFVTQQNEVNIDVLLVKNDQRVKYYLVFSAVKTVAVNLSDNLADTVAIQYHRTQNSGLGLQ